MSTLHLLPIGTVESRVMEELRRGLGESFRVTCQVLDQRLDPEFAFHCERQQYHSTELLMRLKTFVRGDSWRLLGVTQVDLYMPILTFVFGEAEMNNSCALISLHRIRQEFYGLPPDPELARERLLKEGVHELGHTLGLTHCRDYACAMAASHSVEWIDLKNGHFCADCHRRIAIRVPAKKLFGLF
jgi:archaemetzincin